MKCDDCHRTIEDGELAVDWSLKRIENNDNDDHYSEQFLSPRLTGYLCIECFDE